MTYNVLVNVHKICKERLIMSINIHIGSSESKYLKVNQIKFVEDSIWKTWSTLEHFVPSLLQVLKFFKCVKSKI